MRGRRSCSPWAIGIVIAAPCLACSGAQSERPAKSATVDNTALGAGNSQEEAPAEPDENACQGTACDAASDWGALHNDLLAAYRHVVPASDEAIEAAEKQALMAPAGTPPDPELEWMLDEKRESGEFLREWCRQKTNFSAERPFESCSLESLGDGAALLLTFVLECGGDSCSTESYAASPVLRGFVRVPHDIGGGAEASPEGDALFVSSPTGVVLPASEGEEPARDPWGGDEPLILDRIALPSMEISTFAPCFSPTLSPKKRWLVCRDLAGNVLEVSLRGGKPILVEKSGLKRGEVYFVWYAYSWPDPVAFLREDRLKFRVVDADGESFEREISWQE